MKFKYNVYKLINAYFKLFHLIDLYLEKSIGEIFVENKFVTVVYVFTLRNFRHNSGFPTRK